MTAEIPGGYTLWAKKVFQSPIYKKHPLYFKAFFWLVGNAAFTDGYAFKGRVLKRGQLITTYANFADALAYCFNRAVIKPSLKEIRIMLSWLESEGMITVEPLIDGTLTNKGRPSDLTRAYVGLLITVLNFDTYQDMNLYRGKDKGRPSSELGQLRKRKEKEINIYSADSEKILSYLNDKTGKRYRNGKHIEARLKDGASVEDCQRVIDAKLQDDYFLANPKYLNPETLFRPGNFDRYLNESILAKTPARVKEDLFCPRCGRQIFVENDLTPSGCVYCEPREARA